jgi:glycogen debranching enzyme
MAFSKPLGTDAYNDQIVLRNLRGSYNHQESYTLILLDDAGKQLVPEVIATPEELTFGKNGKEVAVCFQDAETAHVRSNAAVFMTKLPVSSWDRVLFYANDVIELAGEDGSLFVTILNGSVRDESVWNGQHDTCTATNLFLLPDDGKCLELKLQLTLFPTYVKPQLRSYQQNLITMADEYRTFAARFSTKEKKYAAATELAAYISWHSVVNPEGYIKYPVMLMTKNKMNRIWSWDYTFNALALADKWPELAYDQYRAMAAMQNEYGSYPDAFNSSSCVWNFVKPPVQGFMLRKMFKIARPDTATVLQLYTSVDRFTRWWFDARMQGSETPVYNHGNDSGWDNSTIFRFGVPVQSPDLCTWLILQMDFLSETAESLGKNAEAAEWKSRSDRLFKTMLSVFTVGDELCAIRVRDRKKIQEQSLLLYVPLLLGDRLPENIRSTLLNRLLQKDKFCCEYGISSESTDSEFFVEDGYWRGAIWPPMALITTELLSVNDRKAEAEKNARQYCDMCTQYGFFENYSALDGHGLRDSGFTWAASVFMILLRDYLHLA